MSIGQRPLLPNLPTNETSIESFFGALLGMTPSRGLSRRKFLQGLSAIVTGVAGSENSSLAYSDRATGQTADSPSVHSYGNGLGASMHPNRRSPGFQLFAPRSRILL